MAWIAQLLPPFSSNAPTEDPRKLQLRLVQSIYDTAIAMQLGEININFQHAEGQKDGGKMPYTTVESVQ